MHLITAKIIVLLPFRVSIEEGASYQPIEKVLDNGGKVVIYPFEFMGNNPPPLTIRDYVSNFGKVRIDIILPINSGEINFSHRKQIRPFLEIANEYLNSFLLHCKTKSKQFWWQPIFLNGFNISQVWYEIQCNDEKNNILYTETGSMGGLPPVGVGINKLIWDRIATDIENGIHPSMIDFYFEQARTGVFSKDVPMIVINTAIALELYISRFCDEYAKK
jgi:hypothetical protein